MNIDDFIKIADESLLISIHTPIEATYGSDGTRWSTCGGPLVFSFRESTVLVNTLYGMCEITFDTFVLDHWKEWAECEYPECEVALLDITQNLAYPMSPHASGVAINGVIGRFDSRGDVLTGMLIEFDTGAKLGIDAVARETLVWCFAGPLTLFKPSAGWADHWYEKRLWSRGEDVT